MTKSQLALLLLALAIAGGCSQPPAPPVQPSVATNTLTVSSASAALEQASTNVKARANNIEANIERFPLSPNVSNVKRETALLKEDASSVSNVAKSLAATSADLASKDAQLKQFSEYAEQIDQKYKELLKKANAKALHERDMGIVRIVLLGLFAVVALFLVGLLRNELKQFLFSLPRRILSLFGWKKKKNDNQGVK